MDKRKGHTMTIGIVLSTVPKYSETFFRNKIKGLQEAGFRVLLFVDYINREDKNFPCNIVAAPNFGKGFIITSWNSLRAILKSVLLHPKRSFTLYQLDKKDGIRFKERIRRVILNQFFLAQKLDWLHFGFGMLAVKRENVAEAMGAKMAVSFRGYDLYLSPLKHPGCYAILFKKDIKYHVLSKEMKNTLINDKIIKNKIEVITPAIDVKFFQSDTAKNKNEVAQIVTVARLHWKKGLEYTLEALALLKQSGVAFHYTIIGSGTELERLVFAAHQLGIRDQITFTGKLSHQEVKNKLDTTEIYLQYSIQEGFCNAVLEAQSMGLLCIVSNAEGLAENVLDTKTGWVVPKRNPETLAEKIRKVIALPEAEKARIRTFAMQRVQNEFHLIKQNHDFVAFYS